MRELLFLRGFLVWKNPDLGGGIPPDPPLGKAAASPKPPPKGSIWMLT
jgi:hypothetical protein